MQGDIASKIDELVQKLKIDTAGMVNSQYIIESAIQDVIDSYNDAIEQKKEMYRWDAKSESLWGYFKRIQKQKEKILKERQKTKNEIEFLKDQINHYKELENKAINEHKNELGTAIFKKRVQLEVEKNIKETMNDVANTVESGAKSGNPYLAAILVTVGVVIDVAKMLFRAAIGIIKIGFSLLTDALGTDMGIGAVFKTFLEMQRIVGKVSADSGLLASESMNFLDKMPLIMNEVLDVGGDIEQVGEAYEAYNRLTNRNRVFSPKEFKSIIELGLGTGLGVESAGELVGNFENLGISLTETLKFTDFVRNKSMAVSQNQTKILKKANELVTELTGFGIEKGLEGMTKLIIKTEKLRVDAKKGVSSFKDAFIDPEKAIEAAASARLLGGNYELYFSQPINLMYESMEDPSELMEKMLKTVKGKAYKTKSGFQIGAADRELIREFATAFGQDADELFNAAIEDAKYSDKIEELRKKGIQTFGLTDEQNDLLTNLMTMNEDGSYSIKLSNGILTRLSEIPSNTEIYAILNQERRNDQSALLRKTLAERIGIAIDRFNIGFSQFFIALDRYFKRHSTIENLDSTVELISTNMIEWIDKEFSKTGSWGQFIHKGSKVANNLINKLLSFWKDPNSALITALKNSMVAIQEALRKYMMLPLKFYSGKLVQKLGEGMNEKSYGLVGKKIEKAGLKMQMETLKESGNDSYLYKDNYESVLKEVETFNEKYGNSELADLAVKSGLKLSTKTLTKAASKIGAKQIAKRIPGIGLAIGVYDAIAEGLEGDWGQAGIALLSGLFSTLPGMGTAISIGLDAANAGIDYAYGDNVIETDDLLVRANGAILKGSKGDALLFFNQMILGQSINESKPNEVNLILKGNISNVLINKDLNINNIDMNSYVKDSSKTILKQVITNLQTSV